MSFLCINIAMEKNKEKNVVEKKKSKEYFTVKIETVAPVILTYKILAETPEEAAEMAGKKKGQQMSGPPIILFAKLGKLKAKVYKAGTSLLQLTKNL
jgi:hypothetical protein